MLRKYFKKSAKFSAIFFFVAVFAFSNVVSFLPLAWQNNKLAESLKIKEARAATLTIVLNQTQTILTDGTTWTVPADWTSGNNTIEVIGGGGSGFTDTTGIAGAGGGGGGAYSIITNLTLTPGATVTYQIGNGGKYGALNGGDTFFNRTAGSAGTCADTSSVCAKGGTGATSATGAAGGVGTSGIGATRLDGGTGGTGSTNSDSGGGGGGAGGPNVGGKTGGAGYSAGTGGGGGGGGGNGGSSSTNGTDGSTTGGAGGAGNLGTGGGTGGSAANGGNGTTSGAGGGGGDSGFNGGNGFAGSNLGGGVGPGGGGGGASSNATVGLGGDGALYGGGGGGGRYGGKGAPGVIVITYNGLTPTRTTWTVPSDWDNANNTIEVIGAGGSGFSAAQGGGTGGGGGGAYSKSVNQTLTPGSTVTYAIGDGGRKTAVGPGSGLAGGDTYFCNSTTNCASIAGTAVIAGAKGGSGATSATGATGGAAASGFAYGTGNAKWSGGAGGTGNATGDSGGGGGGAAGLTANGQVGGIGYTSASGGGGGGGGAGGGSSSAGGAGVAANGGAGGNGPGGTGGGALGANAAGGNATAGTGGGGGGGDTPYSGGNGATGSAPNYGGGGGGGTGDNNSVATGAFFGGEGGHYGGGGGGGLPQGYGGNGVIIITYTQLVLTTTLATGSDPGAATIAPGAAATDVDLFTLQTNSGTEAITSVTVNLSTNSGVQRLAITDASNAELGFTTSPVAGSNAISVSGMSAVSGSATTFKVRVTPLAHTSMPAPDGGAYAITAPVTSWVGAGGYVHAGSDTNPNALTIDNDSPAGTTGAGATSGENAQSAVSWTPPGDADLENIYIYCKTSSMVSGEAPTEGADPAVDATACDGTARMKYKGATSPQTITGLTNGQIYYFRIYARDTNGNFTAYSATQEVSATPSAPATVITVSTSGTHSQYLDSGTTAQYLGGAFTFSINTGSDTVNSITVSQNGTAAGANLPNVRLYFDNGGGYGGGDDTLFGTGSFGSAIAGSMSVTSGTTRSVYVVPDISSSASGGQTIDPSVTAAGVSGGSTFSGLPADIGGAYPSVTIRPNVTSITYPITSPLNGSRIGQSITINGAGFGTTCDGTNNRITIGGAANVVSCTGTTFSNTSISITNFQYSSGDSYGGAATLLVRVGATDDNVNQDMYVYPDVTDVTNPTAYTNAAREYSASDSDGVITINGNHFGTSQGSGSVTVLGQTATGIVSWGATAIQIQIPITIGDGDAGAADYQGNIIAYQGTGGNSSASDTYGGGTYRILPRIISTGPVDLKGGQGQTGVSINGNHLCQDASCVGSPEGTEDITFNTVSGKTGSTWSHTSITTITVPATATDGNLILTSDGDGSGTFTSNALNYNIKFAPTTPTNSSPSGSDISKNPTLTANAFNDGTDGDSHIDSQWQITRVSGDYGAGNKVWEDTSASAQITIDVNSTNGTFTNTTLSTELNCGTNYWWHVRYKDNGEVTSQEWSAYSSEMSFTTVSCGPDATSITNNDEPALMDGGRIGQINVVISGSGFGTVSAGNRATCAGGAGTGCVKIGGTGGQTITDSRVTAWSNTSITIQLSLTDLSTTYGGATTNGLIVYAAGVSDSNGLTFYIYPDITSITAPFGSNDGAREYDSGDTDGIIIITGNKFGTGPTGGSVVVVGGTVATYIADGACDAVDGWAETCVKVQVPTTISNSIDSGYIIITQGTGSGNKESNSTDAQGAINIWPRITGISAASFSDGGFQDGTFTLSGNHFGASAGSISVNGQTQDGVPTWGAASITDVGIPNNGTDSGNIVLTKSDSKTSNSYSTFYIYPQITSFTATQSDGDIQTGTISITGNHFGTGGGNAQILINTVAPSATTPTWSTSTISNVDIPNSGANSGVVKVTNPQTSKQSNDSATFYIYPDITDITNPTVYTNAAREYSASDSDGIITVNGNHFGAAGTITVLGSTATQQTTATCTGSAYQATCVGVQIPTTIADDSYLGNIVLTRTADSKTDTYGGGNYRILPRIISTNPASPVKGESVVIIGNHLCQAGAASCPTGFDANNKITFYNAVDATNFVSWNNTSATTTVPSSAQSGNLVLKSNNYDSNALNLTLGTNAPYPPSNLNQFKSDGSTSITTNSGTNESSVKLAGDLSATSSMTMVLEVEAKPINQAFDEISTIISTPNCVGASCANQQALVSSLSSGTQYHWRARAKNVTSGDASVWVSFGGNSDGNPPTTAADRDFYSDTQTPTILNTCAVSPTANSCDSSAPTDIQAQIRWETFNGESATRQIKYSSANGSCPAGADAAAVYNVLPNTEPSPESALSTSPHSITLNGLTANSTYQYKIKATDAVGNIAYYPSDTTCGSFTTATAQTRLMKTLEFYVGQSTTTISGTSKDFTFNVFISESNFTGSNISINGAFMEIFGISKVDSGNITAGVDFQSGLTPSGIVNYIINPGGTSPTYWTLTRQITNLSWDRPGDDTYSNIVSITVSGDNPITSLLGAKVYVTYYYTPQP